MSNKSNYLRIFWVLALSGLVIDLLTKYAIFYWLDDSSGRKEYEIVPGIFGIVACHEPNLVKSTGLLGTLQSISSPHLPHVNRGALFGIGQGANAIFAGISVFAAAGIIVWITREQGRTDRFLCCALGLILGGTLGNLYDRLVFEGVRDFISVHWYDSLILQWPVFNIADCCLVIGAGLLLLEAALRRPVPQDMVTAEARV